MLCCSSCSWAFAAVSAVHRSAAATFAARVVHGHAAVQKRVNDNENNMSIIIIGLNIRIGKCIITFYLNGILRVISAVMQHRMLREAQKAMAPWVNGQPIYAPISSNCSTQGVPILYSGEQHKGSMLR